MIERDLTQDDIKAEIAAKQALPQTAQRDKEILFLQECLRGEKRIRYMGFGKRIMRMNKDRVG